MVVHRRRRWREGAQIFAEQKYGECGGGVSGRSKKEPSTTTRLSRTFRHFRTFDSPSPTSPHPLRSLPPLSLVSRPGEEEQEQGQAPLISHLITLVLLHIIGKRWAK